MTNSSRAPAQPQARRLRAGKSDDTRLMLPHLVVECRDGRDDDIAVHAAARSMDRQADRLRIACKRRGAPPPAAMDLWPAERFFSLSRGARAAILPA
jgi:hypothetical protein